MWETIENIHWDTHWEDSLGSARSMKLSLNSIQDPQNHVTIFMCKVQNPQGLAVIFHPEIQNQPDPAVTLPV